VPALTPRIHLDLGAGGLLVLPAGRPLGAADAAALAAALAPLRAWLANPSADAAPPLPDSAHTPTDSRSSP
jgi:hypothetical protein